MTAHHTSRSHAFACNARGWRNAMAARPRSWMRELGLVSVLYLAYAASRLASIAPADAATRNGHRILDLERALHIAPEHTLDDLLYTAPRWVSIASAYFYQTLHYVVTATVLVWLYRSAPAAYRRARNWLVAMTFPALVAFWLFPVAPPRSIPGAVAHDIVAEQHGYGWWGAGGGTAPRGFAGLVNDNAAMPSLHVGWALWAGWQLVHSARNPVVRAVGYGYPLITIVVVLSTGNHYLLDVLAGALLAFVAKTFVDRAFPRVRRPRGRGRGQAPPERHDQTAGCSTSWNLSWPHGRGTGQTPIMAEYLKLSQQVTERPLSQWATIAVELLGAESVIVHGEQWDHHVIHKGDGPPLLMYHGIGGHAETYARTLPQIAAAGYHVYAVDALYHGYSSKPPLRDPFDEMQRSQLDAVIDLIDALGYSKVHYEGESMGAGIGQHLALEHSDRVDKLILNGFGLMKTNKPMTEFKPPLGPSMATLFPLSIAAVTDPTYDNIANRLHWLVQDPDRITDEMVRVRQRLYQDPEINASMRQVFGVDLPLPDWAARYANAITEDAVRAAWKSETLILWGDHNPGVGTDYGEYVAEAIDAKFYEFVDAGHWPQWEKPDEYAQVIIEFLDS